MWHKSLCEPKSLFHQCCILLMVSSQTTKLGKFENWQTQSSAFLQILYHQFCANADLAAAALLNRSTRQSSLSSELNALDLTKFSNISCCTCVATVTSLFFFLQGIRFYLIAQISWKSKNSKVLPLIALAWVLSISFSSLHSSNFLSYPLYCTRISCLFRFREPLTSNL